MTLNDAPLFAELRRLSAHGAKLGGISGGAVVLAKAGVMQNRRFTVHWEHFDDLQANSPDLLMERRLYVIDRDRSTCAGGIAPLDMMHAIIRSSHGDDLARAVSDWFIHTGVREAEDPQRHSESSIQRDIDGMPLSALVQATYELMETHLADPLTLRQLAAITSTSERQLQRRFSQETGGGVMKAYMNLRLQKADELIRRTKLPFLEIALTTGFTNQAHFSKTYRQHFNASPSEQRRSRL